MNILKLDFSALGISFIIISKLYCRYAKLLNWLGMDQSP